MTPEYLEKNIAYVEDRIALMSMRVARSKRTSDGLDEGDNTSDLQERLSGFKAKLKALKA